MKNKTTLILITSIIITLLLLKFCNNSKEVNNSQLDSLQLANKVLTEQYGMMSANAQAQQTRAEKAEMMARQRDTIYLTRVKKIFVNAPDTCQPYLVSMQLECDTLIMAHVKSELHKDTLIDTLREIVANRNYVIKNDSIAKVVFKKDLKEAQKEAKKQKRGKVAAWCAGGAMFVLYLVTNIIN